MVSHTWTACPLPARRERLDEHPDDRPAGDEEHRQDPGQVRDVDWAWN